MEPMRPAAAMLGSVYNVRSALSRLGMTLSQSSSHIGLVHAQLPSFHQRSTWTIAIFEEAELVKLSSQAVRCLITDVQDARRLQR